MNTFKMDSGGDSSSNVHYSEIDDNKSTCQKHHNWKQSATYNPYLDRVLQEELFDNTPNNTYSYTRPSNFFHDYGNVFSLNFTANAMSSEEKPEPNSHQMPKTQFIDNLVGNWAPNSTGTYSPFGPQSTSVLSSSVIHTPMPVPFVEVSNKAPNDTIKPLKPTYSDVLTKSVINIRTKACNKDSQTKRDSVRQQIKTEKIDKLKNTVSGARFSNENKDGVTTDKCQMKFSTTVNKSPLFPRKWTSLENLTDSFHMNVKMTDDKTKKKFTDTVHQKVTKTIKKNKSNDENKDVKKVNLNTTKNAAKRSVKNPPKVKNSDLTDKSSLKRFYKTKKRDRIMPLEHFQQQISEYFQKWIKLIFTFILWLFHLVADVCVLSMHMCRDSVLSMWTWTSLHFSTFFSKSLSLIRTFTIFGSIWQRFRKSEKSFGSNAKQSDGNTKSSSKNNINMPTTGEEAMKRLLACKGKDPYSILGVTPSCTDEEIKKYYKRQAFLVHPDKNQQPGAEEAFKILVRAFDMIGEPERRASYDKGVMESAQTDHAYSELSELLAQLQKKMEAAANTIRCSVCGNRHKRTKINRPSYAARNCASCKIHHAAREGDIWAEARCFNFIWKYYAYMDGGVYDITEWASCQRKSLQHLKPDAHLVQYRITLGKQQTSGPDGGGQRSTVNSTQSQSGDRAQSDLENLLNTLYGQGEPGTIGSRRRSKRTK